MATLPHLDVRGRGPEVLLLHGTPCPPDYLAPLADALVAAGHRTLLAHLPGYGRTPARPAPFTFADIERDLEEALVARGVQRVAVVGYSMGGYHALALALSGRVTVSRLVLLAPFAGASKEHGEALRGFARAHTAGGLPPGLMASQMLSPRHAAAHPGAATDVERWLHATPPASLVAELEAAAASPLLYDEVARLRIPVLLRVGTGDVTTPPAMVRRLAAGIAGATLHEVPGAGHSLLHEDPEGTVAAVVQALRST